MAKKKKKTDNKNFFIIALLAVLFMIFVILITLKPSGGLDLKLTKLGQQNFLQIKNTGKVVLTGIDVYVDGNKYKTIETNLLPNKIIEDTLPLTSGIHKITVKTLEGASKSIKTEG